MALAGPGRGEGAEAEGEVVDAADGPVAAALMVVQRAGQWPAAAKPVMPCAETESMTTPASPASAHPGPCEHRNVLGWSGVVRSRSALLPLRTRSPTSPHRSSVRR